MYIGEIQMTKLYIIIPAYNEEENIEFVAREWHEIVREISPMSKLVIIDDGSKDRTYEILVGLKKELPQLEPLTKANEGHGATLLYGYKYAIDSEADYVFQTDSDGQTLPSEFKQFWDLRDDGILIGYRKNRQDGFSRILVTKVLKGVLKVIFGLNVTDANTPYRLMRREYLEKYLPKIPEKFNLANVMLTVLFLHYKEKVQFMPITFRPRQGGENSINFKKITKIGIQAIKDFRVIKRTLR